MFAYLKRKLKYVGLIAIVVAGFLGYDYYDKSANYELTSAEIMAVEIDCFIKKRKKKLVDSTTNEMAYMPCEIAPAVAVQNGFQERHINTRAKLKLKFTSPIDQSVNIVDATRNNVNKEKTIVGGTMNIYASKTVAAEYRF